MKPLSALLGIWLFWCNHALAQETDDPYLWLEDIEGEEALQWVASHNEKTLAALQAHPAFDAIYQKNLQILNADDRIAYPTIQGSYLYNFWQDEEHERGIWRRTTIESYLSPKPSWETLLDIDALSAAEGVNWVYQGAECLAPDYTRCIISLSRGGADAVEMREFEVERKHFVENGFYVPEAKGGVSWKDANTLYVATDFGEGTTTQSGYPRIVKVWKRGTPLEEAEVLFEGEPTDVGIWCYVIHTAARSYHVVVQVITFFEYNFFMVEEGELIKVDLPKDALPAIVKNQLIVNLKSDWTIGDRTHAQGSLISIDYDGFLSGSRDFATIVEPDGRSTVETVATTKDFLLVGMLNNVRSELHQYELEEGIWKGKPVHAPDFGSIDITTTAENTNLYFFTYESFLQPTALYVIPDDETSAKPVRSLPAFFDADRFVVQQQEAVSKDGTRVPYFVVHARDLALTGSHPTLLEGYGGFEVALKSSYDPLVGTAWLERGGVYAVANIRGGGEFGPRWHRAAQKEHRQRAYDDFIAVAEHLIARGITVPEHLGIVGGSNGGLLVGAVFTQRPDLFNAVAAMVPLLDMKRYHKLPPGASWMDEYGNLTIRMTGPT